MTQEQVVNISTEISYQMLKNGAEIYRVEQCVRYISRAYGFPDADCFALLTSLVVTVTNGEKICTRTKRVTDRTTNFDKVAAYNDLSRYLCTNRPDYFTAHEMLENIRRQKSYSFGKMTGTYVFISFFFGLLYGGDFITALLTGAIGTVIYPIQWIGEKIESNLFFINMITSAAMAFCVCIVHSFIYPYHMDAMVIGLIMNLVPGVALTHCMRDLISNELISGLARLAEVFISAAGTAVGVFVVLTLFGLSV